MKNQPPVLPGEVASDKGLPLNRRLERDDDEFHHRRLAEEMAIIAEIGRLISSTLDIDEVYERFAAEVRKLIYFDRISVNLINPDGETFTISYISGFDIAGRRVGDKVPLAGSITEVIYLTRIGLCFHPASEEEIVNRFPNASATTTFRAGMRSIMAVPLISRNEVIGALHFRSIKPNVYSNRDLLLAERIGEQISGAIANAQLYAGLKKTEEELRRSRQLSTRLAGEMAIIAGIGRLVTSTLNIEEIYEKFAMEARKLIDFDRVSINLLNPDGESLTNAYVYGFHIPERTAGTIVPLAGSFSEIFVRERRGRIIHVESQEDLMKQLPGVTASPVVRAGIRSMIGVPLISRGEVIGVLHIRSLKRNAYNEEDFRLAERIGEQIAGAIANGQLYGSHKKTEKSLRESEELYSRLLAAVPDAVVRTDVYGRIRFVNDIAIRMTGYFRADELIGKNILHFIPREERERAMENYRLMLEGRQGPREYHLIAKDGGQIPIEVNGNFLRDDDGAPFGIVIVCRDITVRKALEQEVRDTLDMLESRVRDRTIELEETNTALRVLLKKGEADQRKLEEGIRANIDQLVMPFLIKLRAAQTSENALAYLNILETNLNNIVSPFINQLSAAYRSLSPKEIKIAALIKEGKSSKEISQLMGVSVGTIITHRNNIRKKLRLRSKSVNLRSHLLFMS